MPQPGDYSLDDLEEIIRSTDSHLDASLDINSFGNCFQHDEINKQIPDQKEFQFKQQNEIDTTKQHDHLMSDESLNYNENNGCHFGFSAFPSPPTSHHSAGYSSPYETPARTSSTSSIDGDHFNPDDFINFLNDDTIKIDDMVQDAIIKLNEDSRNTPSPTGSCTSSSGSSTSGVQSDASSIVSMPQNFKCNLNQTQDDDLLEFLKFKNEKPEVDINKSNNIVLQSSMSDQQLDNNYILTATTPINVNSEEVPATTNTATSTLATVSLPVMPVSTIQSVTPVNIVQGNIIPVQTVPITDINSVVNIKTPTAIKHNSKTSAIKSDVISPVKMVTNTTRITTPVNINNVNNSSPKVSSPPNTKPKTIFLSSNDFKALMQKMNSNGKKVSGSQNQMPKIIMKTANGKVITANKLTCTNSNSSPLATSTSSSAVTNNSSTPTSSLNSQPIQFTPKVVKTGPMVIKQHPSKIVTTNTRSATALAAARASLGHTKAWRADLNMLKNINDDKLLKKQLRMLKNRESASLSRKKKKEYVERLENRISNLEKENYSLKGVS